MDKFLHEGDSIIERKDNVFGDPVAELCDEEGSRVFEFPATWSDEQIQLALRFANQTFARGIEIGKARKAAEIKACLNIT